MTQEDPEADASAPTADNQDRQPASHAEDRPLTVEAQRYARSAAEQPDTVHGDERRLVELLGATDPSESLESRLRRRAATSAALARVASEDSSTIDGYVDRLVEELKREHIREIDGETGEIGKISHRITDNLVSAIAVIVAEQPERITEVDLSDYAGAVSTNLETGTLRTTAKAFFAGASELQRPGPVIEILGELLGYPDSAVQAWSAGAIGRLAEEYPDAVAATAVDLRSLLDHNDETVQHNVIEALAAIVDTRPDVVAPAADALRGLLDHEDAAIAHNATGVLGRLVETHPNAVAPAVKELRALCDHDERAIRRVAAGTLSRLAGESPDTTG